jgi:hypothetical protein
MISLPIPTPPATCTLCDDEEDTTTENKPTNTAGTVTDYPDILPSTSSTPHTIIQDGLSDLVTDSHLSKMQAELLGSRLQGQNLLAKNVEITSFRQQEKDFEKFCIC